MKLLFVNYSRERGQDDAEQAAALLQSAERIAGLPGLQWKIWFYDDDRHAAGSVYLFDSEESARAWGDRVPEALAKYQGFSDVQVSYYDIDERLSAVTRGPLAFAQQA